MNDEKGLNVDNLTNIENRVDLDNKLGMARQGQELAKLVHDEDWIIRREVARQGYGS